MIILRQKTFTRGDVKAMREIFKSTGGFRHLPKGRSGMKARDVINFQKLSQKIDSGGKLTPREIKQAKALLEHIGLPESSNNVEHLVRKYQNINNPEFMARFNGIHNREALKNPANYDYIRNKKTDKIGKIALKELENIENSEKKLCTSPYFTIRT